MGKSPLAPLVSERLQQTSRQHLGKKRINGRKITILVLFALLAGCIHHLGPMPERPPGSTEGFFKAALSPTLTDQSQSLPDGATPFSNRILKELATTLRYSFIAMSMAVPAGLFLGFFASTAWWPSGANATLSRLLLRPLHLAVRTTTTLMRSVHELIWAILLLAALGHDPMTACIALALPFTGTLAKVFSEIIDEQIALAHAHAITSGASPLQAFLATLIPQSFPDMATYTLYRFECSLRSSAVLGFVGIETIGLSIRKSFENNFYNELWTELYLLLVVIIIVDIMGARLRKQLNSIAPRTKNTPPSSSTAERIKSLKATTPRWKMPRILLWATLLLTLISWFPGALGIPADQLVKDSSHIDRSQRVSHFITKLTPQPLRENPLGQNGSLAETAAWADNLWQTNGKEALINTLAMATAAVIISALLAWLIIPWGSRAIAQRHPLEVYSGQTSQLTNILWKSYGIITRLFFILSRAIPEYIYAYLLIGILGISAWPLVFALAVHNLGILGRLWGEVIENQPTPAPKQLLYTGSSRLQTYLHSFIPSSFNRFLMYLFYRWETCVREATVLGMLGFASLGLHIQLARSFSRAYDEMLYYVLLGAAMILIGDLISVLLRRSLKKQ